MSLNGMRHVTFFPGSQNVNATELGHEYKAHSARILASHAGVFRRARISSRVGGYEDT